MEGEEVIIAKGKKPVVKLVPVEEKKKFKFGLLDGKVSCDNVDFFEPMSEEELRLWEGSGEDRFDEALT